MIEIVVGAITAGVGGYLTFVLRRLDGTLQQVETNTRALFGDDDLGFPGLMQMATDGGEVTDE